MSALDEIFLAVLAISWRATLLILLLVGVRLVLRRLVAPSMIFATWLMLAGVLLIPLRVPIPWDPLGWMNPAKSPMPSSVVSKTDAEIAEGLAAETILPLLPLPRMSDEKREEHERGYVHFEILGASVSSERSHFSSVVLIWACGVLVLLTLRVWSMVRLWQKLHGERLPVERGLAYEVRQSCADLGIRRIPAIVVTPLVRTPALCGILRPQLLFPVGLANTLSAEELRWVVRHELGHLCRRDLLAQALLQGACAVHWFNPLVWLAARLARHDCELACDDFVLRRTVANDHTDYGRTLLKVLGRTPDQSRLPATVGIVEGRRQLLRRITWISDYRPQALWRQIVGAGLLAIVAFIGITRASYSETAEPIATNTQREMAPAPVRIPAGDAEPGRSAAVTFPMSAEHQAARAARQAELEAWERDVTFELCGIGRVGGVPVALIAVNGNLVAAVRGSRLIRFMVTEVDVEKEQVTLLRTGEPVRVVTLTDQNPIPLPEINDRTLQTLLSQEGIRRMNDYRGMPSELAMVWDKISREGQAEVLMSYLRRGLVVGVIVRPNGINGYGGKLFGEQISQRSRAALDAFLASLTPGQREAYGSSHQMAIRFTDPPNERERQLAVARAAESRRAQMLSELTPKQRELYEQYQGWSGQPVNR